MGLSKNGGLLISSPIPYLDEGLFGRVFLWILDILPYLHKNGIYPAWHIQSGLYGVGPDQVAVPGVLDLSYTPPSRIVKEVSLVDLRNRHASRLGFDWQGINRLWTAYFSIPERVRDAADAVGVDDRTLGIHYRGTDKIVSAWDSNMLTQEDMLVLVEDYLDQRPDISKIFLATDENTFAQLLKARFSQEVISLGSVKHHKDLVGEERSDFQDADRAMLDCLLLSRCGEVLLTSSALSAFAKILSPRLKIFRCAASKMLWDGPYFPVAYIPVYEAKTTAGRAILNRTLAGDWREDPLANRYSRTFISRPNWAWRNQAIRRLLKRQWLRLTRKHEPAPLDFFYR